MSDPARRYLPTRGDDLVADELDRAAADLTAKGWPITVDDLAEAVDVMELPRLPSQAEWETARTVPVVVSGEVQEALHLASDAELAEHHRTAMEGQRYGAAVVIEREQARRAELRREHWTTPQPGQKPQKRRHP